MKGRTTSSQLNQIMIPTTANGMEECIALKRNMLMGSSKKRILGAAVAVNALDKMELVRNWSNNLKAEFTSWMFSEFMCAISGQDNYVSTVREYEGPFGEWHNERLCAPKGFMKEGQQNYQSYQGIFTGNTTVDL